MQMIPSSIISLDDTHRLAVDGSRTLAKPAAPRRCAQRLAVAPDIAAGVTTVSGSPLLQPTSADGRLGSPFPELLPTAGPSSSGCVAAPTRSRAPRCLSKIGPKATTLLLPSALATKPSGTVEPPPPPPRTREERDAKHKLVLLLWESFRYQRRQMASWYSSNTSAASSNTVSGGATPVSKGHSPASRSVSLSPAALGSPIRPQVGDHNTTAACNDHGENGINRRRSSALAPPLPEATSSLLAKPQRSPLDTVPSHVEGTTVGEGQALRVPKPSTLPQGPDNSILPPSDFRIALDRSDQSTTVNLPDAKTSSTSKSQPSTSVDCSDQQRQSNSKMSLWGGLSSDESGLLYDGDLDSLEARLLQNSVDTIASQWKAMVKQLDTIWDQIEGDVDTKYMKLKMRITSMLLWERLECSRSMLSPPLDTIRQMNEEHERRLASLPKGSLFHPTFHGDNSSGATIVSPPLSLTPPTGTHTNFQTSGAFGRYFPLRVAAESSMLGSNFGSPNEDAGPKGGNASVMSSVAIDT